LRHVTDLKGERQAAAEPRGTRLPRIVIVDDADDVRRLVRIRLRLSGRMEVVGEGATGLEAVDAARAHRPDLMLLDVSMPQMDGLEALPQIFESSPDTRVVMYSGFAEQGLADRALELGASAFLEKSTSLRALPGQLLAVLDGAGPHNGGPPDPASLTADDPAPTPGPAPDLPGDAAPADAPDDSTAADEAVLREHLERFREVFDVAAIGMATVTLAGQLVRANSAMTTILGRPVSQLIGTSYADLAGAAAEQVEHAVGDILSGATRLAQVEHEVVRDDAPATVLATLAPVLDSSERPLYLFLQVQDVTAQRGAEEELRQSEARFRLLVENVEDYAIFMLSTDGTVQSWNAGAERIKGYTEAEIVGRHFRTFYPPALQESRHPERELMLALRDGHYEEEGWRIRKDGTRFWANVLITAVHDGDGKHVGFAKVTRDISERRAHEVALQASEERFRMLVEAVADYAIFMLDPDGRVASWNTGAQRINGYTEAEIVGRHFRAFYPLEQREARHPEHELELALRDGRYEEESWRIRKDGSRFWANVVITPVRDDHGQLLGFAKIVRDTSERRAMQEEREEAASALAAANARLQQAAEDQAHFLAVTAHELRTPAGVLAGTADTLREHWAQLEAEDRDDLLDGMRSSGVRLRRLLADLLTAARLQNSALDLTMEQVDLAQVLQVAASTTRRVHPGAEVVVEALPGTLVLGDADRLAQAVDNLIGNALRHGVPPVRVITRWVDDGPDAPVGDGVAAGPRLEIVVTDAGPGVTQEMQDRLFARFATGRSKGGTGLGLYIVRQLARAHQGDAWYRPAAPDTPGSGEFVISLPPLGTRQP